MRISILPFVFLILLLIAASANAAEPVLRIDAGMHTATIRRVGVDSKGKMLATASDDKTVRLWELPSGRLINTIRPHIGSGNEGKIYAVDLSPDGSIVACGGWSSEGDNDIFVFSTVNGRMVTRVSGIPNVINHLAFSSDGTLLAASLGGAGGVRVFGVAGDKSNLKLRLLAQDMDYSDQSYGAHISPDRTRLVTSSLDGFIRLYDISKLNFKPNDVSNNQPTLLNPAITYQAKKVKKPYSVKYSADGRKIAVGYANADKIDVLNSKDLKPILRDVPQKGLPGIMPSVAWSQDGTQLLLGGSGDEAFTTPLMSGLDAKGVSIAFPIAFDARNVISDIISLPDGTFVYSSHEPSFGLFSLSKSTSSALMFVAPPSIRMQDNDSKLLVSADGSLISFGGSRNNNKCTYSGINRTFSCDNNNPAGLSPARTDDSSLSVKNWKDTTSPTLNNVPLNLEQYEYSRSLAIAHDSSVFLLGTEWRLRLFDRHGKELWSVNTPEVAWSVNITADGRFAVAAFGDGTVRWYRMSNGKELLAFFPHADKKRWVVWTPGGYYDASPGGEELIGWHINNGKDAAADFYPSSKFRTAKYRPGIVASVLQSQNEVEAAQLWDSKQSRKAIEVELGKLLPPVATIISPINGSSVSNDRLTISYLLRSPSGDPITNIKLLVDGRPVSQERGLKAVDKITGEQKITITIPKHDCEVSIIAENKNGSSVPSTIRLLWVKETQQKDEFIVKPKLYVLAVGVSNYQKNDLNLRYAAKDAMDIAAVFEKQSGGLYREVVTKVLTDANATRDGVMDSLDWLQKESTSKDVVVLFIAGHGVNDPNGIYYYLPHNVDPDKLKRTGVAFSDIKNTLASLAGKALFFVDTCHSGNVMGGRRGATDITGLINELSSAENGAVVFASSTGRQYSLEDQKWGNGAFTRALVEGLNGKADYSGSGKITINMLDLWLSERVKELTQGKQTPTTTKPVTIQDFPVAVKL